MSNYAAIKSEDVANGPGVRVSVFLSGCPHHCPGCFNQEAWDYNYGNPVTLQTINEIRFLLNRPFVQGLTLLGGEPMDESNLWASTYLAVAAKELGKDVWIYTGYTIEKIKELALKNSMYNILLSFCDVLVDGPFIQAQADKRLVFKGSANQRIIDIKTSLIDHKLVLWKGKSDL